MTTSSINSAVPPSVSLPNTYITHRSDGFDSSWRPSNNFRDYIPPTGHPRTAGLDDADVYEYSKAVLSQSKPKVLFGPWFELLDKPFVGITSDGIVRKDIYTLGDDGAPTKQMKQAVNNTNPCRRKWCNPEIVFHDVGIRLEFLEQRKIELVLKLLKAGLSQCGFEKAVGAMRLNHFLGEIVHAKAILNQQSYHFRIFGEPSEQEPWGFSFFGHHLCLHIFVLQKQMTISPIFIGAEPIEIDCGPYEGLKLFNNESSMALELMHSLSPELQSQAQLYKKMHDPAMPKNRWHPADQRHLGGAFQDNRVIPYEGIKATALLAQQKKLLLSVVASFLEILPDAVLISRMRQIETFLKETYFCWIGGFGNEDPFYYRIQSPVICVEFDHHAGVFLLNAEPAKCHVHTIVRTPNRNDYSKEWLRIFRGQKRNVGSSIS
ncbi:hypothetical protein LCER1_G000207 [Lachnellula cervina]|uniref:Uncharacterized protein n=1 Tax=Lachnellula cervina TaxID=1316786 RepID=A0A7D8UVP5_9HELO|nr:hypothetical protein LCER1_G000207 [Lachnellula cervina]